MKRFTGVLVIWGLSLLAISASADRKATYRYPKQAEGKLSTATWKAQKTEMGRFEKLIRPHIGNRPLTYMEGGFKVVPGRRAKVKLDPLSRQLVLTTNGDKAVTAKQMVDALQSGKARFSRLERIAGKVPFTTARSAIGRWKKANPIGKEQIFLKEIAAGVADSVASLAPKVAARAGRALTALKGVHQRLKASGISDSAKVDGARGELGKLVSSTTGQLPGKGHGQLETRAKTFLAKATPKQLAQFRAAWERFVKSNSNQKAAAAGGMVAAAAGPITQEIKGTVLIATQNHHNVQVQLKSLAESVAAAIPKATDFKRYYPMQKGTRRFVNNTRFTLWSAIFTDNVQVNVGSLWSKVDPRAAGNALAAAGLEHALNKVEGHVPSAQR